jgi:hypothetical protein
LTYTSWLQHFVSYEWNMFWSIDITNKHPKNDLTINVSLLLEHVKKNLLIVWLPIITININLSTLIKNNYFFGAFFLKHKILQQNIPIPIFFCNSAKFCKNKMLVLVYFKPLNYNLYPYIPQWIWYWLIFIMFITQTSGNTKFNMTIAFHLYWKYKLQKH